MKRNIIIAITIIFTFMIGIFVGCNMKERANNKNVSDKTEKNVIHNDITKVSQESRIPEIDIKPDEEYETVADAEEKKERRSHTGTSIDFCKEAANKLENICWKGGRWEGYNDNKKFVVEIKNKNEKYMDVFHENNKESYQLTILGDAWWLEDNSVSLEPISYICRLDYIPEEPSLGMADYYQGILQFDEENNIILALDKLSGTSVLQNSDFVVLKKVK